MKNKNRFSPNLAQLPFAFFLCVFAAVPLWGQEDWISETAPNDLPRVYEAGYRETVSFYKTRVSEEEFRAYLSFWIRESDFGELSDLIQFCAEDQQLLNFAYPDLFSDGKFAEEFWASLKKLKRKNLDYESICAAFLEVLEKNPSPRNDQIRLEVLREIMDWHRAKPASIRPFNALQGRPGSDIFLEPFERELPDEMLNDFVQELRQTIQKAIGEKNFLKDAPKIKYLCWIALSNPKPFESAVPELRELFRRVRRKYEARLKSSLEKFPTDEKTSELDRLAYHLAAALVMLDAQDTEAGAYLAENANWRFVPYPFGRVREKYQVPVSFTAEFPWEKCIAEQYSHPEECLEVPLVTLLYEKARHQKQPDPRQCVELWEKFLEESRKNSCVILPEDAFNFADLSPEMAERVQKFLVDSWNQTDQLPNDMRKILLSLTEYFLERDDSYDFFFRLVQECDDAMFQDADSILWPRITYREKVPELLKKRLETTSDPRTKARLEGLLESISILPKP